MLSPMGWLNSLTGSGVVIIGCIFGFLIIYQSKKISAKLLFILGLVIIFISLLFLGQFVDFLSILFTGRNLNPPYIYALLCYMWVAPAVVTGFYLGAELMIPEKKKLIVSIYTILGIIFEFFLWFDSANSFTIKLPDSPGSDIIDITFNRSHPTFILIAFFLISTLIFSGLGFALKAKQTSGELRKKFTFLSIGYFIFVITGALDSLTDPGVGLFIVRLGYQSSTWLLYFGLKEERVKPIKLHSEKDLTLEESKLSLIETLSQSRPAKISEKEVTFYREQKVCLVCKGEAISFNIYVCPSCEALYCRKCALALSELENACWACDNPLDESKPTQIYKKELEEVEIEISENSEKKPKREKKIFKKY
ncbi:MAG: B-box zinc finger protein [Promethearchaeota archaeon]